MITFSEIRRRYASSYERILKRGKIKSETEQYIIAGVLADLSSAANDEGHKMLGQLVTQYEQRP